MIDIRDHGGVFAGGRNKKLHLPSNPSTDSRLFTNLTNTQRIESTNGNYYAYSISGSNVVRDEYDKNGTLLNTIQSTSPTAPWGTTVFISQNYVLVPAYNGTVYEVHKFDKHLNLIQSFTTVGTVIVSGQKDINKNGYAVLIDSGSAAVIYDQSGTEVLRYPSSTFALDVLPAWITDDLFLACTGGSSGTWVLCSASSINMSSSITTNTNFGTIFKKLSSMIKTKTV